MTTKNRLSQLEKTQAAQAQDDGGLAEFDGVKMTQEEAEAKAAALPKGVFLICIDWVGVANGDH